MDVLPKNRTLPIRGDMVRTLRIQRKWGSTKEFADGIGMSEDRLEVIERGGAKVFATTLVKIAEALDVHWRDLLCDHATVEQAPAPEVKSRTQPMQVIITGKKSADLTEEDVDRIRAKVRELTGVQGEIELISLEDGSIILTLGMEDEDLARTVAAFCTDKLDPLSVGGMRLPGDRAIWEKLRRRYDEADQLARLLGKKAVAFGEAFDDATITRICSEYEVESGLPNVLCSTVEAKVRRSARLLYEALSRQPGGYTIDIDDSGSLNLKRTGLIADR